MLQERLIFEIGRQALASVLAKSMFALPECRVASVSTVGHRRHEQLPSAGAHFWNFCMVDAGRRDLRVEICGFGSLNFKSRKLWNRMYFDHAHFLFIAYFHAYFRDDDQKRPQLGKYCHTAGKQGTDPHIQESCSPASSLPWPFQAFLAQNMYILRTHSRKNGWCAVLGQKRPETAKNGKCSIERVRLANADANRSQVRPEHVSGGGASVLAPRPVVSKVMRIEW